MDLKEKIAVITGGISGIGRATARGLAAENVRAIALVDRGENTTKVAEEMNREFEREIMIPFQGDVVDADFRESVFCRMEERFGPVNLCVPAAGITRDRLAVKIDKSSDPGKVDLYSEADFRRVIDVDLIAPVYWALRCIGSVAQDRAKRGIKRWEPE